MEKMLEELEQEMANGIFGFTELARIIDYKKAQLTVVPDLVEEKDILPLSDLLRVSFVGSIYCLFPMRILPSTLAYAVIEELIMTVDLSLSISHSR